MTTETLRGYLRARLKPESLITRNVKHRRHREHPNLILFKYTVDADFSDPLVCVCRGIILDEDADWEVVSRPFPKFFNLGEQGAADIHWPSVRVQEKLDGTLIQLYHYKGRWRVGTVGSPDASGAVQKAGINAAFRRDAMPSFAEHFLATYEASGGQLPDWGQRHLTFLFELTGPDNRVVVTYDRPGVTLLAVRNRETDEEYTPEGFRRLGVPIVRTFELKDAGGAQASFEGVSGVVQEGYVVVDAQFRRVKIKNPEYLKLHRLKDGLTPRAMMELARTGEASEVCATFPELTRELENACSRYRSFCRAVRETYAMLEDEMDAWAASLRLDERKPGDDARAFAERAKPYAYSGALFAMRRRRSLEEYLRGVHVDSLIGWMMDMSNA